MADERQTEDKRILIEMLVTIEKRLHIIAFERGGNAEGRSRFRKEFIRILVSSGVK